MEEILNKINLEIEENMKQNEYNSDEYVSGIIYGLIIARDIINKNNKE